MIPPKQRVAYSPEATEKRKQDNSRFRYLLPLTLDIKWEVLPTTIQLKGQLRWWNRGDRSFTGWKESSQGEAGRYRKSKPSDCSEKLANRQQNLIPEGSLAGMILDPVLEIKEPCMLSE